MLELGAPEAFLWSYVSSTPIAAAVTTLDTEGGAALERELVQACASFLTDGVLQGPVRMTTVSVVR